MQRLDAGVGEREPSAWITISKDYQATIGGDAEFMMVPGCGHFQMTVAMTDPKTSLCRAVIAQMGLG